MWVSSLVDARILAANAAACSIYGYSESEFLAQTVFDFRTPAEAARLRPVLEEIRRSGAVPPHSLWQHQTKDGRPLLFDVLANIVDTSSGPAVFAVLRDIAHERELESEQARLFDLSDDILLIRSREGRLIHVNPAYHRMLGWDAEDLKRFDPVDLIHPEDRAARDAAFESGWRDGGAKRWECRIRGKDGSFRWLQWSGIFDLESQRWYSVGRDVSGQKEAHHARAWLAAMVESSSQAFIGTSLDGTILSWNCAAEKLFGYSASEMLGESIIRLVPPERWSRAAEVLNQVRREIDVPEIETVLADRSGLAFNASFQISFVRDENGDTMGAAAICRDISAKTQAEGRAEAQLAQLTALRSIDQSITSTTDLAATLNVVVDRIFATTDVDTVGVFLLGTSPDSLELSVGSRRDGKPPEDSDLSIAETVARECVASAWIASSNLAASAFLGLDVRGDEATAWDGRPLIAKGVTLGALLVRYRTGVSRQAEQFYFLDALAGQAAIAIDAGLLFRNLQRTRDEVLAAYDETLMGWARALDLRDHDTEGHSRRVTELTLSLAGKAGVPESELPDMRRGALLHDIGKIGVPDQILLKSGPLTDEEWRQMRRHPDLGVQLLEPISFLRPALDIVLYHHERWDGTGYPKGLAGEAIPLGARIFALADVWDALCSDRPYRPAWDVAQVREYISGESGRQFDPELVPVFLGLMDEPPAGVIAEGGPTRDPRPA